jgi:hypothetical protein
MSNKNMHFYIIFARNLAQSPQRFRRTCEALNDAEAAVCPGGCRR